MRTICFCNSNLAWGGGEKWHLEAAGWFAANGWRVVLVCHPEGELFKRASEAGKIEIKTVAIGKLSFLNPRLVRGLRSFFEEILPDAVILNLPSDLKAAGCAAKKAGVRHIIYRRGSALPVKNSLLNRYLYQKVITRLIANSKATAEAALINNAELIPHERVSIIYNGIDIQAFDSALERAKEHPPVWAKSPSDGPRTFTLGNAGRLNRQKGQHYLLHLLKELNERNETDICFKLVIAGEGELLDDLRKLAERLGVTGQVVFAGFLKDLSPFWRAIDCFVLSSLWEGFGFVLAEAMLARLPVLAFGVSNIPEIVEEGVSGRLFPLPENEEQPDMRPLAGAVFELAASSKLCSAFGEAGRKLAAERYSQEQAMRRLESLLL